MSSSLLDEELCTSNDSDFSDLFPTPDTNSSDLDEIVTVVGEDGETYVEEGVVSATVAEEPAPVKRGRGRPRKTAVVEEKPKEAAAVPVKRGRGRPAKKEVVQTVEEKPEDEVSVVVEKKTRSKRVSVDDFAPEVINKIYDEYSLKPAAELAEELGIQEKYIHKLVDRLVDLFGMAVSTGDLSSKDFNEIICPKLSEYYEPKDNVEAFVRTKVKCLGKK